MKKSSTTGNDYELVIKTLKEIDGMDDLMITKKVGMCWSRWSINHVRTKEWTLCQTTTISFTVYDFYSLYGS